MTVQLRSKAQAYRPVPGRPLVLGGVAEGAEGLVLADLARSVAAGSAPPAVSLTVICRDGPRMATLARALAFFAPDIEVLRVSGVGLSAIRPHVAASGRGRAAHD